MLFSVASLQLPTIIADNAGYDSADLVAQLRAAHQENRTTYGLSEFGPCTTTHVHQGQCRSAGVVLPQMSTGGSVERCACVSHLQLLCVCVCVFFPLRHV